MRKSHDGGPARATRDDDSIGSDISSKDQFDIIIPVKPSAWSLLQDGTDHTSVSSITTEDRLYSSKSVQIDTDYSTVNSTSSLCCCTSATLSGTTTTTTATTAPSITAASDHSLNADGGYRCTPRLNPHRRRAAAIADIQQHFATQQNNLIRQQYLATREAVADDQGRHATWIQCFGHGPAYDPVTGALIQQSNIGSNSRDQPATTAHVNRTSALFDVALSEDDQDAGGNVTCSGTGVASGASDHQGMTQRFKNSLRRALPWKRKNAFSKREMDYIPELSAEAAITSRRRPQHLRSHSCGNIVS